MRPGARGLRLLLAPLRLLLALLILFEEWGWEPLQRLMARIARLPLLRRLDAAVGRLSPYAALVVFVVPGLTLLPVKLAALWLIGRGRPVLGLAVIVAAKVVGTAVVARLFTLTRPALMRLPWYAALHGRWMAFKQGLLAWVRGSAAWQALHALRLRMRQTWRTWRARWF